MSAVQGRILERLQQLPDSLLRDVLQYIDFLLWRRSSRRDEAMSATGISEPHSSSDVSVQVREKPFSEIILEAAEQIPNNELHKIPNDASKNVDVYLYENL